MAARILLAVLAIGALLGIAGRSIAPHVSTAAWLFWCAMAGGALAVTLIGGLVVSLQARQLVLRKGGTDSQWLAFSSEPEGLVSLRKQSQGDSHGE